MEILSKLALPIIISAVIGYLIGSVCFSIILTKIFANKTDIRNYGSGNAGATNVLRSVGRLPAALTFLFDFLKCIISVVIGYFILKYACEKAGVPEYMAIIGKYAAGIACVIGHIFPLYFKFKGGKGVTTSIAMIFLLDWRVALLALGTFIIILSIKKIISLSSIIAAVLYPIYTFIVGYFLDFTGSPLAGHSDKSLNYIIAITIAAVLLGALIVLVHRENIGRLLKGEEKTISFKKKEQNAG